MNNSLRKIAFFVGCGLLLISIYWSQDGFNFDMAGDSGYGTVALIIGYFLGVTVSVVQFVFSSNFKDLNPSLILFGILAYVYSIYTNYEGILHFQGMAQSKTGAFILGLVMDGVPEPLIAWGLYESLSGDFIGNILKTLGSAPGRIQSQNVSKLEGKHTENNQKSQDHQVKREIRPEFFNNLSRGKENSQRRPNRYNLDE